MQGRRKDTDRSVSNVVLKHQVLQEIEVANAFLVSLDDDILYIKVKPNVYVELELVQEVVAIERKITDGKAILVVLDVSEADGVSKEAREYTSGNAVEGLHIAMAIIVASLPMRLLANFFINFDKPPAPTRLFNSKKQGVEWLSSFKDQ